MPVSLKLVSLNVETSHHLERVLPFLEKEMPDVATIQELNESDISLFSETLGATSNIFEPMSRELRNGVVTRSGIAIFSRLLMKEHSVRYYKGSPEHVDASDHLKPETYNFCNRVLLTCDVEKNGKTFRIATTHFTWTPVGNQPSDEQRRDIQPLLAMLKDAGSVVLTGDFNSARGSEIFSLVAEEYRDNIPPEYTTSIDPVLHRAGPLPYMVDGLFSTQAYAVTGVRLVDGLSDHMAVIAEVRKA